MRRANSPILEDAVRHAHRIVMQHHADRILLGQRVHDHLVAVDRHVRPLEVRQGGQHRHRGTVDHISLVIEHVQVDLQRPDLLVGLDAQRLQVDAVRVLEGALQNAVRL